jgi:hypothetical protein
MLTADNIVAKAKSRLQLHEDSFFDALLLDDMFSEFKQFKNRETWVLTDMCLKVCGDTVQLPCKAADVERVRFYVADSDDEVYLALTDPQKTQEFNIQSRGTFYFNGNKIVISSEDYDGYDVKLLYWGFIYDVDTLEPCLPDEYGDAASSFLCYRYLLYNPSPMNMGLMREHQKNYLDKMRQLRGEANKTNTPEKFQVGQIRNAIARNGFNLKYSW